MSKAILVMDMPKSCSECRFSGNDGDICCLINREISFDEYDKQKPEWCPLQELPEKKTYKCHIDENIMRGYRDGYNTCIDEILKGSEENE